MRSAESGAGDVRASVLPTERPHLPDEKLVSLVGGGDLEALAELYDRFGSVAYGLAFAVLEDCSLAENAVEEGYLDVWRSARSFPPDGGSVRAWVLVLVHRRAVARARAASHAGDRDRREVIPGGVSDLLAPLPAEEREAISLAYFGGRTRSQLAAIARVTAETIGERMLSGLRNLGPSLEPVADGGRSRPSNSSHVSRN